MRAGGTFRQALGVLALGIVLARGAAAAAASAAPPAVAAAAWEFAGLDGARHRIAWPSQTGGGVLVFFFDLRSADSLLGLNFCEALAQRAGDFGLTVVGVEATGRQPAEVRAALEGFARLYRQPSFTVAADPEGAAAKVFGSPRPPAALVIGPRGEIVARKSSFDQGTAVELTRTVERLLARDEGFFSQALRDTSVSEAREGELSARPAPSADDAVPVQALAWGDRLPPFDFVDTAGRPGRWAWPVEGVIRIAFFWNGAAEDAAEGTAFLEGLLRGEAGGFLEAIAVESTGMSTDLARARFARGRPGAPAGSLRIVPDPERYLVGLFGVGAPLPRTFLLGAKGEVLFRADGFGADVRQMLQDKIARAARLAGLGLPSAPEEVQRAAAGGEAPSIVRIQDRDKELRFNLSRGDYFFSNGQHARAVPHYKRYLELEPDSLHALVRLAQSHDLLGDAAQARGYWERVLAISPGHAEARARLQALGRGATP